MIVIHISKKNVIGKSPAPRSTNFFVVYCIELRPNSFLFTKLMHECVNEMKLATMQYGNNRKLVYLYGGNSPSFRSWKRIFRLLSLQLVISVQRTLQNLLNRSWNFGLFRSRSEKYFKQLASTGNLRARTQMKKLSQVYCWNSIHR